MAQQRAMGAMVAFLVVLFMISSSAVAAPTCAVGQGVVSGVCKGCAVAQYSAGGAGATCKTCPAGQQPNAARGACVPIPNCAAGKGLSAGVCAPCAATLYSAGGPNALCKACAAGQQPNAARSACVPIPNCAAGKGLSAGVCAPCAATLYSAGGPNALCKACAAGQQPNAAKSACVAVPNTYSATYATFYEGVTKTPQASMCKAMIDGLSLATTMSNPKLALTIMVPSNDAITAMAKTLGLQTTALTSSMSKNGALLKQIMYYHFVTGSNGAKGVYATWDMKAGMVLDTMYISSTKKPYQLAVGSVTGTRVVIKSVGTSATTFLPNIKCGAGVAHGIDNMLLPLAVSTIAKYV